MTLGHGPKIATNGLVFSYDMDSVKSYNGPQTTNSATGIVPVYNTETSLFTMYPTYEDVYVPQIGWVRNCLAMTMYNDYNGGSGNCCPSPILYYTGGNTTTNVKTSTLYTYAIVYKSTNGYTHPNFMYRYEYGPSGYLTEGGVFSTSRRIHLGNDWYWAWGTFTSQSDTTNMTPRCFQYQYATWNKLYVAKVMLVEGDYTEMHPKFWPELSEAITDTNSVLDSTGNNTLTASNLQYNSDGKFEFNGSNSVITMPNNSLLNMASQLSIEAWVNFDGNSTDFIFEKGNVNTQYSLFSHGTDVVFRTYHSGDDSYHTQNPSKSSVGVVNGTSVHILATYDGSNKKIYINGVLKNTVAKTGDLVTTTPGAAVGRFGGTTTGYYFDGKIYSVKVYNRALSATEVARNFEALRGRYGI